MKIFKTVFFLEFSRLLKKRKVIALLLFFIMLGLLIHGGKNNHHSLIENSKIFRQTEQLRVAQYLTYTYYGWYGIRLMLIPSEFSIVTGGIFDHMVSNVNSAERLNIHNQLKGQHLFSPQYHYMDFSGLVLLIGSLLGLVYGFRGTYCKEYLKFLSSLSTPKATFVAVVCSRLIILNAIFLLTCLVSLLWLLAGGINLINIYSLWYILIGFLVFTFFVLLGSIFGSIPKKVTGLILVGISYFCSAFLIPFVIFKSTQFNASDLQSPYIVELQNLELIMKFEQRAKGEQGKYKKETTSPEKVKQIIADVLKDEYQAFQKSETSIKDNILDKINYYHQISSFFPIPLYLSLCNEISGKGYMGFIDFYTYSQKQKAKFIDFYVQKKFFTDTASGQVEPFIKGSENLFFAPSRLPGYLWLGLILHIIYNLLLASASYYCYKRNIAGNLSELPDIAINIKPGQLNFLLTGNQGLKNYPYRYFTALGGPLPPVFVNGKELADRNFIYLPSTQCFPNSIEKKLIRYLANDEKFLSAPLWRVLFQYAKKSRKVIIFDNFFATLKVPEIESIKDEIITDGLVSLYISKDEYLGYSIAQQLIFSASDDTVEPVRLLNPKRD